MSSFITRDQQGAYLYVDYDLSKLFLWDNRYENGTINNSTYADVTYNPGTVLGRVASTGYLVPFSASASDGSQYVVGVLNDGLVVAAGERAYVSYCVSGDVAVDQLILSGSDTLATLVTGRSRNVKDCIAADAVGLHLVMSEGLTFPDNH
jgi:hypothetical protein